MTEPADAQEEPTIEELEAELTTLLQTVETVLLAAFPNVEARVLDSPTPCTLLSLQTVDGRRGLYGRQRQADGRSAIVPISKLTLRGKNAAALRLDALIREARKAQSRLYEETEAAIQLARAALESARLTQETPS